MEEKGTLELTSSLTGKLPYVTPDGQPLIKLEYPKEQPTTFWPTSYDPNLVVDCKLHTLRPDVIGFKNI